MNPPPPAEGFATRLFVGPALRTQPDRRLVTLVREGYDAAFEEIVRRYQMGLGRYAATIVGGRSEDVTQDSFSKALLALRRDPEAEIDLKPWLYRIVRNTALNDLRDRPPETAELIEALGTGSRSAAEEAERREEMAELMQRLRDLPEPQRAAIVMRELEGLGHDEIAAALGLSGGGARQTIYRARRALRDGLGLIVPVPLLRALIEHGSDAGVAAAGTGAGGAAVAIGGAGAGAGAGTALKVGVVTVVLAGSVGTGLAIKDGRSDRHHAESAAAATVPENAASSAEPTAGSAAPGGRPPGGPDSGGNADRGGSDAAGPGPGLDGGSEVRGGSGPAAGSPGSGGGSNGVRGNVGHGGGGHSGPRGEGAGHEHVPPGPQPVTRNHPPAGGGHGPGGGHSGGGDLGVGPRAENSGPGSGSGPGPGPSAGGDGPPPEDPPLEGEGDSRGPGGQGQRSGGSEDGA